MKNLLLLIALLISISACSTVEPLEEIDFVGFSQIEKGETAEIKWQVKNADSVFISDMDGSFSWKDTIEVAPESSKKYTFRFTNKLDTLEKVWRVYVKQSNEEYLSSNQDLSYTASYSNSEYLKGILTDGKMTSPYQMKILSVDYDPDPEKPLKLKALILDEFGNYLPSLSNELLNWTIDHKCNDMISQSPVISFEELEPIANNSELCFMVDNSASSNYGIQLLNHIKSFSSDLYVSDKVQLSFFNQNNLMAYPLSLKDDIIMASLDKPEPSGLNALYKSVYQNIVKMKSNSKNKSLIILTFSSNNAATIYNIQDVIKISKKYNTPIYVVALGDAIDSYSMKYLSYATGGRYYNVNLENMDEVKDILHEIRFSNLANYQLTIDKLDNLDCDEVYSKIKLSFNDKEYEDNIQIISNPQWLSSRNQSIAAFDYKSTDVNIEYNELIKSLSRVLQDNPSYSVELIGHSSIEGSSEKNNEISLARADSIKNKLVSMGVQANQLKTKGEGSNMPLYFMPNSPWQQFYNRRVEVRWLIPEMMPFEIIADQYWTEEEAISKVQEWRKRGFRSYYQRYLINNKPSYRIKLWGYETLAEAQSELKKLSNKYRIQMEIE